MTKIYRALSGCSLLAKRYPLLKTCWRNVVLSFVDFLRAVLKICPTKSCATFLDHLIRILNSPSLLDSIFWKIFYVQVQLFTFFFLQMHSKLSIIPPMIFSILCLCCFYFTILFLNVMPNISG